MPRRPGVILAVTLAAAAFAASAQEQDPLRTHHERAQSFLLAAEFDRAETEYRHEVLPRALRRLGNLSGAEGRIDESIELLDEAARHSPGDIEIQIDLAVAWLRKRDLAAAGRLADRIVAAAPSHARARSLSGRIRLLAGDAAQAAAELRQALDLEARFETAYGLALASLHLRRLETARALFDQMMVANATPDLLVLIGRAYLEANYPALAAEEFGRALARDSRARDARHYLTLARAAIATGRAPDASAMRSVLLDLLPTAGSIDEQRRSEMRAQLTDVLATVWHNLGIIHDRRGEHDRAAEARQRAALWSPGRDAASGASLDRERAIADAGRLLQEGDVAGAERAIAPVIAQQPELPAALRILGMARSAQGRYDEAEALLRKALDREGSEHAALVALAHVYVARGEFGRAVATLDRAPAAVQEAANPLRVRAYLGVGRVADARALLADVAARAGPAEAADVAEALLGRSMTVEAEALLETARQRGQSSGRLLLATARLHLQQNDDSRAEALLHDVLSRDPGSVDALRLLAQIASKGGDAARAVDLLSRAREIAPDSPELLEELAEASIRAARPDVALSAARRLAAVRPDDAEARHLLAVTLLQNQNWDEAVAILASPPPSAARDARWPLALGLAERGRRNLEAARDAFQRVLALDSGHVEARYQLGLIAREQGRTADAIEALSAVLVRDPAHAPAHLAIGTVYLLNEDLGRAQRHLSCAATLDPDDPAPHYQLALLYRRIGDEQAARGEIQQFEEKRHKSLAEAHATVVKTPSRKGGC